MQRLMSRVYVYMYVWLGAKSFVFCPPLPFWQPSRDNNEPQRCVFNLNMDMIAHNDINTINIHGPAKCAWLSRLLTRGLISSSI
jgi:hypothetical protein